MFNILLAVSVLAPFNLVFPLQLGRERQAEIAASLKTMVESTDTPDFTWNWRLVSLQLAWQSFTFTGVAVTLIVLIGIGRCVSLLHSCSDVSVFRIVRSRTSALMCSALVNIPELVLNLNDDEPIACARRRQHLLSRAERTAPVSPVAGAGRPDDPQWLWLYGPIGS